MIWCHNQGFKYFPKNEGITADFKLYSNQYCSLFVFHLFYLNIDLQQCVWFQKLVCNLRLPLPWDYSAWHTNQGSDHWCFFSRRYFIWWTKGMQGIEHSRGPYFPSRVQFYGLHCWNCWWWACRHWSYPSTWKACRCLFFSTIMMLAFPTLHKHAHTDTYSLWIYGFFFFLLTVHILIV